jgi:hypothetical protein
MRRANILNSICLVCLFLAGCSGASSSSNSSNNGTGNSSGVIVTVTPVTATVVIQQSAAFQAKVTGTTNTAVTWEVNGIVNGDTTVGTILAGLYTAPGAVPSPASVTVTAVSQANTAVSQSATVLVVSANQNQVAQSIPVKLGTSGGNANDSSVQGNLIYCCGGTLGSLVQRNGTYYILSNNHVLARSDAASIGDAITQPDLIDANCSTVGTTTVGNLTQYVNLEAGTYNADAAIAQIVSGTVDTSGSILSLGSSAPNGVPDAGPPHAGNGIVASVGETVAKSGRSSGLTCSSIDATTITASVSYQKGCSTGAMFTATYTGQISVQGGTFSAEGDSGSLIVDQKTADPVALLYGGSDADTVGNPVADVLNALKDPQGNKPTFIGSSATHSVAGCTIALNVVKTAQAQNNVTFTSAQLAQAQHARDMHAPDLLANPYIQALGVGASIDHPGEPAVVVVVNPAEVPIAIPQQLEGVATRILQGTSSSPRGIFEPDVAARVAPVVDTFAINSLSSTEMARAKIVHAAHVSALMKEAGVQGVGITSSADAPGEAALMIFVIRGVTRSAIPVVIDGVRTRIRESSRFTAGNRGNDVPRTGCPVPPMKTASVTSTQ